MSLERIVRISLWVTAPFNLIAGFAISFPASGLGQLLELPSGSHPFYTILSGALVGIFGLAYIWLASQARISKPLLFVGASGKSAAVILTATLFVNDMVSSTLAFMISGDLLFAGLWFYFLYQDS